MTTQAYWLFGSLIGVLLIAGIKWLIKSDQWNSLFFGFMILLTATLYAAVVLKLRITGLNTSVGIVEAAREDVVGIAKDVSELADVVANITGVFQTLTPEQKEQVRQIRDRINERIKCIEGSSCSP
jgi:hypothetical protein